MNVPLSINNKNQSMQNITLRSHVGTDGNLQLKSPPHFLTSSDLND